MEDVEGDVVYERGQRDRLNASAQVKSESARGGSDRREQRERGDQHTVWSSYPARSASSVVSPST
jgi:hypothetical protein